MLSPHVVVDVVAPASEESPSSEADVRRIAPRRASRLVVLARLTLFLIAALAVAAGFALAHGRDRAAHAGAALYACPMHPEVTSAGPGECPICGMALERAVSATSGGALRVAATVIERVKRRAFAAEDLRRQRPPAWVSDDAIVTAVLY